MEKTANLDGIKREPEKTKNRTVLIQAVVCAIAVLSILMLGRSGTAIYNNVKKDYNSLMSEDYCADGVIESAKDLFKKAVQTDTAIAEIKESAAVQTVKSAGGEDIRVLDALTDSTLDAVYVSKAAVTPVSGRVTSEFGCRIHPITGNESFHTGIDIAAAEGTQIAAAYSGIVAETGYTSGRGNYILLRHGENLQTLYCHLSKINVEKDTVLTAGETIGLVGSTGLSTGPHLHFELRVDGVRCDPRYALTLGD